MSGYKSFRDRAIRLVLIAVVTATGNQVVPSLRSGCCANPAPDYGAQTDAFLVTWSSSNDVYGRRVYSPRSEAEREASSGDLLGEVIDVATGSNYPQIAPDVGYNALIKDWFAVWHGLMLLGWLGPRGQVVHGNGALSGNSQLL